MNSKKLLRILFILLFTPFYLLAQQTIVPITLQLSWMHQFEYAGYYAAKEKGFYEDVGLDVQFVEMDSSKKDSVIEDVLSGKITYAIDYSSIIKSYLDGKDIIFVANFFKHSPLVVVSQENIKIPSDLRNKKFMGGYDALKNTSIQMMFDQFNIQKEDFINVPQSFDINDFIEKKVDATTIFLTNQAYKLNKIGFKYTILNPESYGAEFYVDNLFTSKNELLNYPMRVKNFKEATIKGWEYALKHKEEIVDLILQKYNTQNKTKEELLFEARQTENLILPNVYPIGSIDISRLKRVAELYVQMGLIDENNNFNLSSFIFESNKQNLKLTQEERSYLLGLKKINICVHSNWMPYEQLQGSKYLGMISEYIKQIQKDISISINYIPSEHMHQSFDLLYEQKCDVVPFAVETQSKAKHFNFTSSYLEDALVLVTNSKVPFIHDVSKLKKVKVALIKQCTFNQALQQTYQNLDFIEVQNVQEGLEKVAKGEAFAFLGTLNTAIYMLQNKYIGELKISYKFDERIAFSMAIHEEKPKLYKIFEKLLESIEEKDKEEIYNKYISIKVEQQENYGFLRNLSIFFLIVLVCVFWWNRKLIEEKYKTQKSLKEIKMMKKILEKRNIELRNIMLLDHLTQIFNRQKLDKELQKELWRSDRSKEEFSLIMVDIDFFKKVNDTYGHLVGDEILIEFSQMIKKSIRRVDTLGRWGGEEFLIVCPNTNNEGAIKKAQRIRKNIEEHTFAKVGKLTASLGATTYKPNDTEYSIINRVDMAMYNAKQNGRNQVVFFS